MQERVPHDAESEISVAISMQSDTLLALSQRLFDLADLGSNCPDPMA